MQRVSVNWPLSICCIPVRMTCSSMTGATRHSGCVPSMPRNSVILCAGMVHSEVKAFEADGAKERIVVGPTACGNAAKAICLALRVRLIRVESR